jgi:uncharacterized delta-60 repeat protein
MTQKFTGKVTTDFGGTDLGQSVAIQSDGKILVGGGSGDKTKTTFALVRYNSDGTLDAAFGNNGKVTTGSFSFFGKDTINEIKVQPDGKILAAGTTGYDFAVARYNVDGSLDTTFDTDGKLTTNFDAIALVKTGATDEAQSLIVQENGKFLMVGSSNSTSYPSYNYFSPSISSYSSRTLFALARYNSDGSIDTSFDIDGKVTTSIGSPKDNSSYNNVTGSVRISSSLYDYANSVVVQSDGKILVAGGTGYTDFSLARYNSDGSLDVSFDSDGKVITNFGASEEAQSVVIQSDGKILVGGYSGDYSSHNFAIARYNNDGSLDTTFDTDGKVTTDFGGDDKGYRLAVQNDGKILIGGYSGDNFALARYNGDGSLDETFNTSGRVTTDFGGDDKAYSLAIQSDGKIVLAGTSNNDFAAARYNSNGALDTTFGLESAELPFSNTSPTGGVKILGIAKQDEVLSVKSTLADDDGLGDFEYQWLGNGYEIYGANAATYKISASDIGKKISLKVSYIDGEGTLETATSVPTAVVITKISTSPTTGNDLLTGTIKNDTLSGLAGDDTLIGGLGVDKLIGGKGTDVFKFNAINETGTNSKTRDVITDFNHSEGDKIDLSNIDANPTSYYDHSFKFIGGKAFSGIAGELRFDSTNKILYGNANNDKVPDFAIQLNGVSSLVAADFIL